MTTAKIPERRRTVSRSAQRADRKAKDLSRRKPSSLGRGRSPRPRVSPVTYAVLAVAALLAVAPLYWMFVVGSNTSAAISSSPPVLFPGGNFVSNIIKVEGDVPFVRSLLNSAIVALSVAVLQIFFCSLAGFAFAKLRFRGRNGLFVFIIATMAIPSQLGLVPLYLIMSDIGWIDTLQALIAPGAVTAFGVFWMRQVIVGSMPDELIEAARIDGCSTFRTFRSVVFPTIRGAAAVFGLFAAMSAWNDFLWPLVELSTPSNFTVQVAIQQLRTNYQSIDYSTTLAASFLATLPLLVLFAVAGKQLVAGIMEGAVKG